VVTDRDLLATASGAEDQNAGSCASEVLVTIAPDERLEVACELMRAHGVSHVMVVDPQRNQPLGVVSTLDIAGIVAWGRA
jgi:CBS domain-containing protein